MDKVIICGVFEFAGFHFCNRFLEKGCIVKGIHWDDGSCSNLEEKKLEVGRNANFTEIIGGEAARSLRDFQPAVTIVSPYDLYMADRDDTREQTPSLERIISFIKTRNNELEQMVYLLPLQLLADSCGEKDLTELKNFLQDVNDIHDRMQLFYLPALYGPWQPSSFQFQRSLMEEQEERRYECATLKEWIWDAVYIDDALEAILKIIESGASGSYLIESGMKDSWGECADLLKIDHSFRESLQKPSIICKGGITRVQVNKALTYRDSLARQREHIARTIHFDGLI